MSADPIIDLEDVAVPSRRDSEKRVIEQVNWKVAPGELWVIGGPQAPAKSDLIFLLAGLTRPLDGCYLLFGQDMGKRFGDEFLPNRLRMGMVFDDARLFAAQSIAENVALPIRYHQNLAGEESAGWVGALLAEVGVADLAGEMPGSVSRQLRRRAALARALALRPELLFVENALRGLDARHAMWWVNTLQKLQTGHPLMAGKPMTVVTTTDEFWPWRNSGAKFATVDGDRFSSSGESLPPEFSPYGLAPSGPGVETARVPKQE